MQNNSLMTFNCVKKQLSIYVVIYSVNKTMTIVMINGEIINANQPEYLSIKLQRRAIAFIFVLYHASCTKSH